MKKLVLLKTSTENEIKTYFRNVLELKQSGTEFPVNLDEVWMLVYPRKDHAVRELKENFIQDVDYQVFPKIGENPLGGRPTENYNLSVSCLEYFIARKVRPVFEVYRQVFHRVAEQKPLSPAEQLLQQAQLMVAQEKRMLAIESKVKEIEAKTTTRPDYFTIVGYGTLHNISVNIKQAATLGRKAALLCKKRNIATDKMPDPRFGEVKMYPKNILDEVFN
jgi:hypothetical protein